MKKWVVTTGLVLGGLSSSVIAAGNVGYVGLGYGVTSFKIDCNDAPNCKTHSSGPKIFAGVNLDSIFALEGAYVNLGTMKRDFGIGTDSVDASAFIGDVAARYKFIPEFTGVFRAGLSRSTTKARGDLTVSNSLLANNNNAVMAHSEASTNSVKPYWGFGLEYQFTRNLTGYAAADFVRTAGFDYGCINGDCLGQVSSGHVELYTVGAQLGF